MEVRNYGILTSIDWNSNNWKDVPAEEDQNSLNLGYVSENGLTYTSLNFGHDIYPADDEGYYHGFLPQFRSQGLDENKSKYVEVFFVKSQDWRDKQNHIVGLYVKPILKMGIKPSPIASFSDDIEVNVKALPKNIHLLENFINLTGNPELKKFISKGKDAGKQGFNFLSKENVFKILDAMSKLNPGDLKLQGLKYRIITSIEKK